MAYFLGIDVGGTKTDYVLGDDTAVLARARTGTIKRMRADAATASEHLAAGLCSLTKQSGISMNLITRNCVGTAGDTVALVVDWLRTELTSRVSGQLLIVGDVEIALDAAFYGGPGIVVLAGTGSNAAGRSPQGLLSTTGGWGPVIADQGSGHRIGLEAVRSTFLAIDEDRPTHLVDALLRFWSLRSLDELVAYANNTPALDFSRLTRLVVECAAQGDAVANEVLTREGEALGYLVRLLIRRLRRRDDPLFTPSLAFAGSIAENVGPVRKALMCDVKREFADVQEIAGVVDPVLGALWRATSGAGFER